MDEEDNVWLKLINEQRSSCDPPQSQVAQDQFELLMDRLEKECHFQQSTAAATLSASTAHNSSNNTSLNSSLNDSKTHADTTSEDALCCICLDGECVNSNAILFCDMCNLAVHQECYGVPYIPEGQWLCRRCIQSPSTPVTCLLCPNAHGAFKQTERGQWAHVVCAIWVPEVHFANTVFLEPIIGIENIDKARWKLTCYICRKRGSGACIQCDKHNCYTAFHVTCAQSAGLYMNIKEETVELDETQTNQKKKKGRPSSNQNANNSSLAEVRKQAFCDIHTPLDVLSPRTQKQLGITDGGHVGLNHAECEEAMKKAQKQRMKRARKILAAKQNSSPTVCLPVIPKEKINEIMNKLADEEIDEKEAFFGKLMNYWLLKRYSRNGVPLLRRLQHSASLRKHIQYQANGRNQQLNNSSKNEDATLNDSSNSDHHSTKSASTKQSSVQEQLSYWKKLRQDLERARLLMELVRKRERIKRDLVRLHQLETAYEVNPFNGVFLQRLLDLLVELDKSSFFYEPVNPVEAPDYYDEIREPMCFREMQTKLDAGRYKNFEGFEYDYNLIVSNCLQFNPKGTVFYKAAFKLREQASSLIKQAKRMYDNVGFDEWVDKSEEALGAIKKEIKMMNCKNKAGKVAAASERHECEAHVDNSTAATNSNDTSFNTTEEA
jgi:bromodomain and PHD finger-containing protein 1